MKIVLIDDSSNIVNASEADQLGELLFLEQVAQALKHWDVTYTVQPKTNTFIAKALGGSYSVFRGD